jgi:uncharacterized protein
LAGADPSEIATGKAYQLLWNLVGLAKLYRATGEAGLLDAVQTLWTRVHDHHLTPGGGPWGGVAHRSREVFNAAGAFDPGAYVETCSVLAWLQLSRELLALTGEARYAEAIERTAYNDLLGAQAPNGEDWCYYSFANGRRVHTTYWRCCKSSGAMALEELPGVAWALTGDQVMLAVHGPGSLAFEQAGASVRLESATDYPFDGRVCLRVRTTQPVLLTLRLRVPDWSDGATVAVGDEPAHAVAAGWAVLTRTWQDGDELRLVLPMAPGLLHACLRNVQESRAPDGLPVAQEVLRREFVALRRGPLVFATGLVDGYKAEESLRLPDKVQAAVSYQAGNVTPVLRLHPIGREAIAFLPAFLADGRQDGGWRLTWMPLAPTQPIAQEPAA